MAEAMKRQQFLQIVMHRGILEERELKDVCRSIYETSEFGTRQQQLNNSLQNLGIKLENIRCELTGKKYYVLFTTSITDTGSEDDTMAFSRGELELLTVIFRLIINSENGCVSSIDCINSVSELSEKITQSRAQQFINTMTAKKWLSQADGKIYMGVRSALDFSSLFKTQYGDVLENCGLCPNNVFYGQRCQNCNIKFHFHCLSSFLNIGVDLICANCKAIIVLDER